jgi:hypothetical protein
MKIGYCVEGSSDRALIKGLHQRWCPAAELIEGPFRGNFLRREIPKVCFELATKGVDLIVFLRDSNREDWRTVRGADLERRDPRFAHLTVFGVCARNVEDWIVADPEWFSRETASPANSFRVGDPKGPVEAALGVTHRERQELRIAELVQRAPLRHWLRNQSFEQFYDDLRGHCVRLGCVIENLRERVDRG